MRRATSGSAARSASNRALEWRIPLPAEPESAERQ